MLLMTGNLYFKSPYHSQQVLKEYIDAMKGQGESNKIYLEMDITDVNADWLALDDDRYVIQVAFRAEIDEVYNDLEHGFDEHIVKDFFKRYIKYYTREMAISYSYMDEISIEIMDEVEDEPWKDIMDNSDINRRIDETVNKVNKTFKSLGESKPKHQTSTQKRDCKEKVGTGRKIFVIKDEE